MAAPRNQFGLGRELDVQIPNGLAAARNVGLKGEREIVHGRGNFVCKLPAHCIACREFAVGRCRVTHYRLIILLSSGVLEGELKNAGKILLLGGGILECHVNDQERVASFGLEYIITCARFDGVDGNGVCVAYIDLIADFEVLVP